MKGASSRKKYIYCGAAISHRTKHADEADFIPKSADRCKWLHGGPYRELGVVFVDLPDPVESQ